MNKPRCSLLVRSFSP